MPGEVIAPHSPPHGPKKGMGRGSLPSIAVDRCVHHRSAAASCRACADACPQGAWAVDKDGVSFHAPYCDGCGLCAPSCPQEVIAHTHRPARRRQGGRPVAFAACAQTGLRNAHDGGDDGVDGVMPCVNALSLADLARLYGAGVRTLVVARKHCASCPTGLSTTMRLERAVAELNVLLEGRSAPPLRLTQRSAVPWQAYLIFDTEPDDAETPDDAIPLAGNLPRPVLPPLADTAPWPWVPSIDERLCGGCAACARLCPTGAIRVAGEPAAFRIAAETCNGCHLCVDACAPGALMLERLAPRRQTMAALPSDRKR